MKTIDIKGKPYVEVNERIKYFREHFKGWALISELISNENGVCIFKASVIDENGVVKATGYAYEKENSTFINKTSYIENCETSAWGRALGNLGIGIDISIASYEEVANAIENQKEPKKPTNKTERFMSVEHYNQLKEALDDKHGSFKSEEAIEELSFLCQKRGISNMKQIPDDLAEEIIKEIKETPF